MRWMPSRRVERRSQSSLRRALAILGVLLVAGVPLTALGAVRAAAVDAVSGSEAAYGQVAPEAADLPQIVSPTTAVAPIGTPNSSSAPVAAVAGGATTAANGSTVSGKVTLTSSTVSIGVGDRLRFEVDRVIVGTASVAPYLVTWDTTTHSNGPATITITLLDSNNAPVPGVAPAVLHVTVANRPKVPLTVTLDFDDGTADQAQAGPMLAARGMKGVFFINSGRIGLSAKYMTVDQIRTLAQAGNEIGGHTAFHLHLPQQSVAEQERQICTDRDQLLALGFKVTDMAFPFGDFTSESQQIAQHCGYDSARTSEDGAGGQDSLPPANPYGMTALSSLGLTTTAAFVIGKVKDAEQHGSGIVQIVFHHLCAKAPCRTNAVTVGVFTAILNWLEAQRSAGAVQIKTVAQAVGAPVRPAVAAPPPTANLGVANSSFEQGSLAAGVPTCWEHTVDGDNDNATWSLVRDAHSGTWAQKLSATSLSNGVGLVVTQDEGSCAAPATVGDRYSYGMWYRSTAPVHLVAYRRLAAGGYLTFGLTKPFPASPQKWTYVTVMTRPLPAGSTGISIGAEVTNVGTFFFDDFTLSDAGPPPPKVTPTPAVVVPAGPQPPPSVAPVTIPRVPLAATAEVRRSVSWRGRLILLASVVGVVLALIAVDRRLSVIRRRTKPAEARGARDNAQHFWGRSWR